MIKGLVITALMNINTHPPNHYVSINTVLTVSKNSHFLNSTHPPSTYAEVIYGWPLIFLTIHSNGRVTGDHGTDEDQHQGFSWGCRGCGGHRGRGGHQTVRVEACSMHRWSVHCAACCHFFIGVIHLMIPWSWTCLVSTCNCKIKGLLPLLGGFQLEFVSISRVINHMTCYKFECSHWLKLQHSDWRANLVKDFF